jgi:hypothetical protein
MEEWIYRSIFSWSRHWLEEVNGSFTPRPFYLRGKSPRYPLDRRSVEPTVITQNGDKRQDTLEMMKHSLIMAFSYLFYMTCLTNNLYSFANSYGLWGLEEDRTELSALLNFGTAVSGVQHLNSIIKFGWLFNYLSMAVHTPCGPSPLFQFLNPLHSR